MYRMCLTGCLGRSTRLQTGPNNYNSTSNEHLVWQTLFTTCLWGWNGAHVEDPQRNLSHFPRP